MVRLIVRLVMVLVASAVMFCAGWLIGRTGIGSVKDPASLPDLERQFVERMTNVTMVGSFTVDARSVTSRPLEKV